MNKEFHLYFNEEEYHILRTVAEVSDTISSSCRRVWKCYGGIMSMTYFEAVNKCCKEVMQ